MQLTLKYNEHATPALSAAFIRGNTPDGWLQEINAWNIPLEKLVCFIVSQNNDPVDAAGLFVVFSKEQLPGMLQVRHPYTVVGGKLYIPVNGELSPAISEQELQSLLIWDYQVFHPTIGFVGFERSDRIELVELLQYNEPRPVYWGYAKAGVAPWIPLRQINVEQLSAEEVFDSIKDLISNKPLEDIPKANKREVPLWLNNSIASGIFKGVYFLISGLSSILTLPARLFGSLGNSAGGNKSEQAADDKEPGLFKKMMNWMEEKIGDLEKQRDSELKRLSDMFEKNTDEALKYAIPLNSQYLSRGTAKPSAQLTKRSLHFNLGRLGGGYAIDGWNVDNYYDDLRRKYLMAAQNAIEEKDFKKAAYVYAHLLGDYTAAADTLRRGKHYREAAVLYKEHLKNLSMAAICLEEGGMYPEAIEMYTGLNQHEKAGDLYMTLDQKEPALECYEKCVLAAAANKDHLEESRIITDKIGDRSRAKKVLLQGWKDIKQPEACLIKYFDLVADDDKKEVHNAVKAFYANNELAKKEMSFLNVLDKVNQKYKTTELESACQDIAYEIVSEQVNAGNPASLHTLRNFVPGDQLLAPDCFRFIHTFKEVPKQKPTPHQWQLMKEVQWHKALVWNNQLLVWGTKPSGLLLARMSWEGHIEHFNWYLIKPDRPLLPIANPGHSNHILLYGRNESITEKWLPVNKYFQDELIVLRPGFIEANAIGVGFRESEIAVLYQQHGEGFLNYITPGGAVNESIHCTFNDVGNNFSLPPVAAGEMMWCDGNFYLACGQTLLRISEKGAIDVLYYVEAPIQKMAVNKWSHEITIAIAFDNHVLILTGDNDNEYEGPYEVEGIQVADLTFLPDDSLVLAGKKEVQVLNAPTWELDWQMETENDVIGVFPGPLRDQIGILESTGQITLHRIRELE